MVSQKRIIDETPVNSESQPLDCQLPLARQRKAFRKKARKDVSGARKLLYFRSQLCLRFAEPTCCSVCQKEREPTWEGVTLIRRKSLQQRAHVVMSAIEDQDPSEEQARHRVRLIHLKHLPVRINRLLEVALHNVCISRHTSRDRGQGINS